MCSKPKQFRFYSITVILQGKLLQVFSPTLSYFSSIKLHSLFFLFFFKVSFFESFIMKEIVGGEFLCDFRHDAIEETLDDDDTQLCFEH